MAKEGYGKIVGPLEQEILDVLWAKRELTGKAVFAEIKAVRDIALTTVLTVLERLAKKGAVKKAKGESVYLYSPAYTKDEFAREVSQDVFKDILGISASGACASFVDLLADTDPHALERLSRIIENKKKAMERDEK